MHPPAAFEKCETFYYCDSGELEFEVNEQHFHVSPGDLVEIEANEWYGYRTTRRPRKPPQFQCPAL